MDPGFQNIPLSMTRFFQIMSHLDMFFNMSLLQEDDLLLVDEGKPTGIQNIKCLMVSFFLYVLSVDQRFQNIPF